MPQCRLTSYLLQFYLYSVSVLFYVVFCFNLVTSTRRFVSSVCPPLLCKFSSLPHLVVLLSSSLSLFHRLIYSFDVLLNRFSSLMNNRDTCNGSRSHSLICPHTKRSWANNIKAFLCLAVARIANTHSFTQSNCLPFNRLLFFLDFEKYICTQTHRQQANSLH